VFPQVTWRSVWINLKVVSNHGDSDIPNQLIKLFNKKTIMSADAEMTDRAAADVRNIFHFAVEEDGPFDS